MKTLLTLALTLALTLVACTSKVVESAADMTVAEGSYAVMCGCKIDSIGKCGNYIELDGKPVAIADPEALGLGPMEWCSVDHATVKAAGKVEGGAFHATTFETE